MAVSFHKHQDDDKALLGICSLFTACCCKLTSIFIKDVVNLALPLSPFTSRVFSLLCLTQFYWLYWHEEQQCICIGKAIVCSLQTIVIVKGCAKSIMIMAQLWQKRSIIMGR